MSTFRRLKVLYVILAGLFVMQSRAAISNDQVIFFTPYARVSVPPGETVDYTIDVINDSKEVRTFNIIVSGLPGGWDYTVKSGGWNINRISVLPGEKETVKLNVNVPLKVNKGRFLDYSVRTGPENPQRS